MSQQKIFVTKPFLPPLEELIPYLERIWERAVLTNNGPFHQQFEVELARFLGVPHLALFTNGTIALVSALQALRVTGEVITTPYSFVATTHSLLWNGIKPVFADIDPDTLNLDPRKVEAAITPHTTAILPVHCYGNPCDVEALQQIADHYNLKIIYDAAHAFGVEYGGRSILEYGDLSVLSLHATKVFNTFEGGAIACRNARQKQHIEHLKNFGFVNETTVVATGINGKMSEFPAALGLLQLKYVKAAIEERRRIDAYYRRELASVPGIRCVPRGRQTVDNFAYFPILVDESYPLTRDQLYEKLASRGIHGRRYFYPLISNFPMYRGMLSAQPENLPVATRVANQVICLPIYPGLGEEDAARVVEVIVEH